MKRIGSHIRRGDAGFTIIESVVALFVLVVGILSTFVLVEVANSRSAGTRAQEGATNLARELTEQVRTLRFAQLTAADLPGALQAKPGLADGSAAAGWQIVRRGYTFTVAPAVCSIDDFKDGYGDHSAGGFCPDSSTSDNKDAKPEDFRRVRMDVSWSEKGVNRTVRLSATMSSTGQSTGMPVSALWLASPTSPDNAGTATDPVIVTAASPLTFTATAPSTASSLTWTLDGQVMSPAAVRAANGTDWTFSWDVAGRSDGYYTIGAQAVDANGVVGPERTIKVQLLRKVPAAPTGVVGGFNTVMRNGASVEVAELRWLASPERNVVGYRVYRPDGTLACPGDMATLSLETSCIDFSPPAMSATNLKYGVRAVYRDVNGQLQQSLPGEVTLDGNTRVRVAKKLGLKTTTDNTATNCTGTTKQDMSDGYTGETTATFGGPSISFCSEAFQAGDGLPAQTYTFTASVTYAGAKNGCSLTAYLGRNGNQSLSDVVFVKASGTNSYSWSFTTLAASTLNAGDRLTVNLAWDTADRDCAPDMTVLRYAGTGADLGVLAFQADVTKSGITRPPAPSGLKAATQADGTVLLSWTAPTSGDVAFYRIYKGGTEYTQRLGTTGSATEVTFVDTDPQGTFDYYVTSVSSKLAESTYVGPVRP
ncbi:MAG: hypothetical protein M3P50_04765 [Actinomycetota bacterium]|nr:hypothetical protein [Actinomycetota bacterium]